jgi:hypothetical protein
MEGRVQYRCRFCVGNVGRNATSGRVKVEYPSALHVGLSSASHEAEDGEGTGKASSLVEKIESEG